ncbi:sialate O-acetylesterase [Terrimonas pollutisoli]|uniref:sialate O-acetylesterase n=1 Tax=Terrimonas pollutisoli TaxID=3034147 RepID=UPI0023EDA50A|nr:sialate O-acetylesterase [Terrimonas sp. H1YJ31]
MNKSISISFFTASLFLFQSLCYAQVSLPKVFGDNMVLQRGIAIPVWGMAKPGSVVIAKLGTERISAKADKEGKWMLYFPKRKEGGPYELEIFESGKAQTTIKFKGILIGDVWLASGQSNMEWQVQQVQANKDIANLIHGDKSLYEQSNTTNKESNSANYSQIRFFMVEHDKKLSPQQDVLSGTWKICDTVSVRNFSAVAFYFARKIHNDQNVPIGIIQSTWGGTPIESWTSREMLLTSSISKAQAISNDTLSSNDFVNDSLNLVRFWDIVYHPQNNTDKIIPVPDYNDADWTKIEMPNVIKDFGIGHYEGMMWLRKKITLPESFTGKDLTLNIGHPEMNYSLYFNGEEICKTIWNSNPKQFYTIPAKLVKNGENTISLRIAMLWGGGGLNPPAENIYISDGSSKISLAGMWLYKKDIEPAIPKIRNYHYYPTVLFNAMINPLIPYGIKGFLWYQGEANDTAAYDYRKLFPMFIRDWRQRWKQGNLPFLYVQLANYKKRQSLPSESEWAELREAQTLTLLQPNTGMACIIDIGEADNIHPMNKQEVGRRLALIADKLVYKKNVIASGPLYKSFQKEGNRIRINFTNTGSRLSTKDGKEVTGFAIAGKNKQFYWATAMIKGNEIIVFSDRVDEPVAVRYAWADNPECNLINVEGLPAIPFRTDEWKGKTQR